jgi:hypothetical protein
MRVQVETTHPGLSGETVQAFPIRSEPGQALLPLSDDRIQMVKHQVGKLLFAQFIPNMFLRIQLGCLRRQGQQPDVLGDGQVFGLVRTRSVQQHDDEVTRMSLARLGQKLAPAGRVHFAAHSPARGLTAP